VYLLNPNHYGTTENALLEAMACGAVPVVLNNPIEMSIVQNGRTGLVVDSPESFARAISLLNRDPEARRRMGEAARADVLSRFSLETTAQQLNGHYRRVMDMAKRDMDFAFVFGSTPSDWFLSCLGSSQLLFDDPDGCGHRDERLQHPVLYERTKSSAFHFLHYFPDDARLRKWATLLEDDLVSVRA